MGFFTGEVAHARAKCPALMEAKDDSELVIGAKSVELRLLSACPPKIAWCHSAWHNSLFELSKPDGGQIEHVIDDTLDSDVILIQSFHT